MGLVCYNKHINKVTHHFTFMRRAQNANTHVLKRHWLSQNISSACFSFVLVIASDMHLESESEKKKKKNEPKTLIFAQLNGIQVQPTLFRYF